MRRLRTTLKQYTINAKLVSFFFTIPEEQAKKSFKTTGDRADSKGQTTIDVDDDMSVSSVSIGGVNSSDDSDDYDSDAALAGDEFLRRPSIEAIVMRMTTQPPPLTTPTATASAGSSSPKLLAAAPPPLLPVVVGPGPPSPSAAAAASSPIALLSPRSPQTDQADLLAISPVTTPASRHPSIFDAASSLGAPNMFSDSAVSSRGHSPQPQPQAQQQQQQQSAQSASRRMLAEEVAQVLFSA